MIVTATLVAGCTSLDTYDAQYHVVRRGETLYQIAWEHGVDQRDLARWNGLRNPDLIQVGQRLRLTALPGAAAAAPAVSRAPAGSSAAPPAATAARPRQPAPQTAPPARPRRSTAGRTAAGLGMADRRPGREPIRLLAGNRNGRRDRRPRSVRPSARRRRGASSMPAAASSATASSSSSSTTTPIFPRTDT